MKIKVNKHKLNIHYRGSPWGSRTQQHAYCLRYAHSQHIESHLGKKQPQAKIPRAFLFSQLHFNNVTSHALFYGGHLVMRSKRCAVQNQGITLSRSRRLSVQPGKRETSARRILTSVLIDCKSWMVLDRVFFSFSSSFNCPFTAFNEFFVLVRESS